jgi:uncharacterized linocin/CFP29 family protein
VKNLAHSASLHAGENNAPSKPGTKHLGACAHKRVTETTKAGYPILEHVRRIVEGPIVWAPGLAGAVVVSLRGGDFELVVGRDFSIGYLDHDAKQVRLYIEESFTFRLLSPQAAVPLAYGGRCESCHA